MDLEATDLVPSKRRSPCFDSWDTNGVAYACNCPRCDDPLVFSFKQIWDGAWRWRETFTPDEVAEIQAFFSLGPRSLALEGGWPSVSRHSCQRCGAVYIFYADYHEYRNSVFRIAAQGLATVRS